MERETDCPACHGQFAPLFRTQADPRGSKQPIRVDCSRCGRMWIVLYAEPQIESGKTVYSLGDELKDR